jgi:diketogulonate reductase-like aldo/keto reductase
MPAVSGAAGFAANAWTFIGLVSAGFDAAALHIIVVGETGKRIAGRRFGRGVLTMAQGASRRFGSAGRAVSVIGQGTWYIDHGDRAASIKALRRGLDLGMTHIDTAEMYGDAELVVAEAMAGRRDEVFLVSKVLPGNASRRGTVSACERSLKRLRTDRLDCYLLHWRGPYPLAETVAAFEDLAAAGKIMAWGVSNFDTDDLDELLAVAGEKRIACNQVLYHLRERAIEHAVIPWCEAHDVAVVAYSPFGHDDFPSPGSAGGKILKTIADAHHATPRQVALAFLTRNPAVFAVPKASSAAHVVENAGACRLTLSRDDIAALDKAFPRGAEPASLPML